MNFKLWLENSRKKLMVLIHPDCLIELEGSTEKGPFKTIEQYQKQLETHLPKFDYVITHMFFPDNRPWSKLWNQEKVEAYNKFYYAIESLSDVAVSRNTFGCSYRQELPDYLIENPNSDIYMAGGYESNCLWHSYKNLFKELSWLIKENNIEVSLYKPLIFETKYYGGLNPDHTKFKPEDQTYSYEFHPDKVKYREI